MHIGKIGNYYNHSLKFKGNDKSYKSHRELKPFTHVQLGVQILGSLISAGGLYDLSQNLQLSELYHQAQPVQLNIKKILLESGFKFDYKEIGGLNNTILFDISINQIQIPGSVTVEYSPNKIQFTVKKNRETTYADLFFTKHEEPILVIKNDKDDLHGTLIRLNKKEFYSSDVSGKTKSLSKIIAGLLLIGAYRIKRRLDSPRIIDNMNLHYMPEKYENWECEQQKYKEKNSTVIKTGMIFDNDTQSFFPYGFRLALNSNEADLTVYDAFKETVLNAKGEVLADGSIKLEAGEKPAGESAENKLFKEGAEIFIKNKSTDKNFDPKILLSLINAIHKFRNEENDD